MTLPLGSAFDVGLWGGGPSGESLDVSADPARLAVAEQFRCVGSHLRLFRVTAQASGTATLEAVVPACLPGNNRPVWATLTVVVPNHRAAPHPESSATEGAEAERLGWDIFQFALDLVGLVDPTGAADGINGLISLGRGDYLAAGISGLAMIPYIGDMAKVGKLPKYGKSITQAIALARRNSRFAARLMPAMKKLRAALRRVPLDGMPSGAAEQIRRIMAEVDEFLDVANRALPSTLKVGEIGFIGLIRNRPLRDLTHQQVRNALAQVGLHEAHNAHFISRLLERGPEIGINTMDDFARAWNRSAYSVGRDGTVYRALAGTDFMAVLNAEGKLITFSGAAAGL